MTADRLRTGVTTLQADRVHAIRIEAGQVACLATVKRGGFEFLWHERQPKTESTTETACPSPPWTTAVEHRDRRTILRRRSKDV